MKQIFHDVELVEYMVPCWYYVSKRLNLNMEFSEFLLENKIPYASHVSIPDGAILQWDMRRNINRDYQLKIRNDRILNVVMNTKAIPHYCVYEGDGVVSDLCVPSNGSPYIRYRELPSLRDPDFLITFHLNR